MQSDVNPVKARKIRTRLLHAVANRLEATKVVRGEVSRIINNQVRVPLLRFVEAETGVLCEVSCDNNGAVIKSELLRSVVEVDERAVHIIRLVLVPSCCAPAPSTGLSVLFTSSGCCLSPAAVPPPPMLVDGVRNSVKCRVRVRAWVCVRG
jgi:hypothetical protein